MKYIIYGLAGAFLLSGFYAFADLPYLTESSVLKNRVIKKLFIKNSDINLTIIDKDGFVFRNVYIISIDSRYDKILFTSFYGQIEGSLSDLKGFRIESFRKGKAPEKFIILRNGDFFEYSDAKEEKEDLIVSIKYIGEVAIPKKRIAYYSAGKYNREPFKIPYQFNDYSKPHDIISLKQKESIVLVLSNIRGRVCDLSPLSKLKNLNTLHLDIDHLSSDLDILDLSFLSKLTNLKKLTIQSIHSAVKNKDTSVRDLNPLSKLTALEELKIDDLWSVHDLSPLSKLTTLKKLSISGLRGVRDLSPLSKLGALKELKIFDLSRDHDLSPLSKLTGLEELYLRDLKQDRDLVPLSKLRALKNLHIYGLSGVRDLSPLSKLTNLKKLWLDDLSSVRDLSPLSNLTGLEKLYLNKFPSVRDLSPLSKLKALKKLEMYGNANIPNFKRGNGANIHPPIQEEKN